MRIRKQALIAFIASIILAGYLGFADLSLPHDKWIHFAVFFITSFLFYWILDSRYTWTLRNITFLTCTIIGGIGSEYVQHIISPFRSFDYYDILANICGSLSAIISSDLYLWYKGRKKKYGRIRRVQIDLENLPDDLNLLDNDNDIQLVDQSVHVQEAI